MEAIVTRYKFSIFATLLLSALGLLASFYLPISLYPMISNPQVRVTVEIIDEPHTFYLKWGEKIEHAMSEVDGVTYVEATYKPNQVRLFAHFDWGVDPQLAKQKIATAIAFFQAQQPKYLTPVKVDFYDPASENYVAVKSNQFTQDELSEMLINDLLPTLNNIVGVSAAWISKKNEEKIEVSFKPFDLIRYKLAVDEIIEQIENSEFNYNLGNLKTRSNGEIGVFYKAGISSVPQLRNLVIAVRNGVSLRLSDIADVDIVTKESGRFFQYDDENVVAVAVWSEPSANLYQVSKDFVRIVKDYTQDKGDLLILNTPKLFIEESIQNMVIAILLGIVIAALVVLIFYRNLTDIILICISMPATLAICLLVMHGLDIGLNLLSLGAIGISIGMVVDGAVLVIDKLKTHSSSNSYASMAKLLVELWPSLFASTISSLIVFIPLAFTLPMVSSLLKDMVWVTSIMLTISLAINFLFLPAMHVVFNKTRKYSSPEDRSITENNSLLIRCLASSKFTRYSILLTSTLFVLGTISVLHDKIRQEVIAQPKASIIDVNIPFKLDGMTDLQKIEVLQKYRLAIKSKFGKKIDYLYSDIRPDNAYISVHLKHFSDFDFVYENIGKVIHELGDSDVTFEPWVTAALKINALPGLRLNFTAPDKVLNRKLVDDTAAFLSESDAVTRTKSLPNNRTVQSYNAVLSEDVATGTLSNKDYAVTRDTLLDFVKYSVEPREIFNVQLADKYLPLQISIKSDSDRTRSLNAVPVSIDDTALFISDYFTFNAEQQWREYFSTNARLTFAVDAWIKNDISNDLVEKLRAYLGDKYNLKHVPMIIEDTSLETKSALTSLVFALSLSVALVFGVALLQFSSTRLAFIVLMAIPTGIAGALLSLYFFNSTLSLNSMLGMLIIVGLAVNNSIIIVDGYMRASWQTELSQPTILANVLRDRIRPVLVTNMTTIFCMLPLAIGFGAGQDIVKPLGICVAGGLFVSTALTMILVPVSISLFQPQTKTISA